MELGRKFYTIYFKPWEIQLLTNATRFYIAKGHSPEVCESEKLQ